MIDLEVEYRKQKRRESFTAFIFAASVTALVVYVSVCIPY